MKILLCLLTAFSAQLALAADGRTQLDILGDVRAGFDLTLEGNTISGEMYGFGRFGGSNQVRLTKNANGHWDGRIGLYRIDMRSIRTRSPNRIDVSMAVNPTGHGTYRISRESDGDIVVRGFPQRLEGEIEGDASSLNVSTRFLSMELRRRSAGRYEGSLVWQNPYGGLPSNSSATLRSSGALAPEQVRNDPVLYMLLYVLPFGLESRN